jgi:hypothetical protein
MGVRAPDEGGVQHARQLHVVDEAPFPAKEARVFAPRHGRAEILGSHCAISLRGVPWPALNGPHHTCRLARVNGEMKND